MVWSREHSPRFSYARDFRPRGYFSYSPMFDPWAASRARSSRTESRVRAEGNAAATNQMMLVGGAVFGTIAVGALIIMAAKK